MKRGGPRTTSDEARLRAGRRQAASPQHSGAHMERVKSVFRNFLTGAAFSARSARAPRAESAPCPFCGSAADFRFEATALLRHRARYHLCRDCESLFVADPGWLDEAYAYKGVH